MRYEGILNDITVFGCNFSFMIANTSQFYNAINLVTLRFASYWFSYGFNIFKELADVAFFEIFIMSERESREREKNMTDEK